MEKKITNNFLLGVVDPAFPKIRIVSPRSAWHGEVQPAHDGL